MQIERRFGIHAKNVSGSGVVIIIIFIIISLSLLYSGKLSNIGLSDTVDDLPFCPPFTFSTRS